MVPYTQLSCRHQQAGWAGQCTWAQTGAGRGVSPGLDICPSGTARPSCPLMLLEKDQRNQAGQPTEGTIQGATSGYIEAEVVTLFLARKLFHPLSQSTLKGGGVTGLLTLRRFS